MDWFGKSSKVEGKNDMKSLGIRFEPIIFYPDRNEYELRIQLSGYPKDLIRVTYDKPAGKLKVQGLKLKTEFSQQFPIPADCLATGIYGRFRGDALHVIMPRLLSEWTAYEDASSKLEDDKKTDQKAAEQAEQDSDKLPAPPSDQKSIDEVREQEGKDREKLPVPSSDQKLTDEVREQGGKDLDKLPAPSSDQKSTDEVRDKGGKDREELPGKFSATPLSDQKSTDEVRERGGKDRDGLPARVSATPPSDQKSIDELKKIGGKDRDGLPARVPAASVSDPRTTEELRQRDNELFPEISAPPPPTVEPSRSVKELRENYQKNLSKIVAPPPPPPPPTPRTPSHAASWNRSTTEIKARKKEEEDREQPSDPKKAKQGDVELEKSVIKSPKKERKTGKEVVENAKFVSKSKTREESERRKPSAGGKEVLGLVTKVKETGKAAVAAAMKEENRLVVAIGAAVLTIVVIGASLRSASKKTKN